jgi:PAS domain S-box-containing protein
MDPASEHAIYLIDLKGAVQNWNRAAEHLKGYAAEEVIGRQFSIFFSATDQAQGRPGEALERALKEGQYQGREERTRKDGSIFWADVTISAMYNLEGKPSGFVSVTRNLRETTADEKAQEASVAANLRDREALLQEVHHRVNNNLQVIASLFSWQVRQTHNGHTRTALKECQTRVLTIATIHEELYRSSNYSEIPSRIYVGKLAQNVFQAANAPRLRVELLLEVEEFDLPVDQAIPCGLILNELMTNAVKHAFPGNRRGTVVVRLKKTSSGFVELSISEANSTVLEMYTSTGSWSERKIISLACVPVSGLNTMGKTKSASEALTNSIC